jgi:hypothetical protein
LFRTRYTHNLLYIMNIIKTRLTSSDRGAACPEREDGRGSVAGTWSAIIESTAKETRERDIRLRDHEVDPSEQAVMYSYEGRSEEVC